MASSAAEDDRHYQLLVIVLMITFLPLSLRGAAAAGSCRCLPSQECWPDAKTWESFNASVGGALIAAKPLGFPCHDPYFDENACKLVTENSGDPFWRSDQPSALQVPNMEMDGDKGCLLRGDRASECLQGAVPMYVVDVSTVSQVQKAVSFASQHNLRLVIKNSGHDMTGKNTAPGSLSIWVHHLKDITFSDKSHGLAEYEVEAPEAQDPWVTFRTPRSQSCQTGKNTPSVKVGAGVQWEEVYTAAHKNKRTVVGAQCVSVGAAGGYPQGGGHSQLSPSFGLAADNVLEYDVVTADGKLVVANSCQNKELFWALRGGGGGTFGVVTAVTYVAHPALTNLVFASYIITTGPNSTSSAFKDLLAKVISLNPSMADAGWGGFFIAAGKTLIAQYLLPNKDMAFAEKSLQPLLAYVEGWKNELVVVSGKIKEFSSYYEWHLENQCTNGKCGFPSGFSQFEASRLIPRTLAEKSPYKLAEALVSLGEMGFQRISGYLVGGGKVSKAQDNAVNPAWRNALLHVLYVRPFAENSTMETKSSMASEMSSGYKMLTDLTPGSGSYMNEANRNEPSWQQSFFGSNYDALKKIKDKVDPSGLFVCYHCVGSEDWSPDLNCRVSR
ncbi:uncharacterized FAD-linked oxidoreductase ARB_02478 [Selaginella moellendorffii]|uniref:uncharacterized FAD-linked oxidoreductase ARB_02478 n=1 Tax=Selaginella moellendorffii TaxID=88036 RepID=UPI000D1CC0FF|nr:uncharacterized FAD-linked oxidoreductase ARB_02478 [Selaginella moellendorffii]|eukprot:XP_024533884.1 uncharacterized FAD-linked oxidoreductase ARB_02478 [Selaginella moellendorffii]